MHALLRADVTSVAPQVEPSRDSRVESSRVESSRVESSPAASMGPAAAVSAHVDAALGAAGSGRRNDNRVGVELGAAANRGRMQPVGGVGIGKLLKP